MFRWGMIPVCLEVEEESLEPTATWINPEGGRSRQQSPRTVKSLQIASRSPVALGCRRLLMGTGSLLGATYVF